jgi:biopolymer transport protein ExbD
VKFRRQRTEDEGINITPLIDVVFILLLFFMVSTSFTKESHLTVVLPQAIGEPAAEVKAQLEIVISEQGRYSLNGQNLVNTEIETLKSALSKIAQGKIDLPIMITADAKAPHQAVVSVMDAAGQLGFVKLSITTRQPEAVQK